MEGVIMTQPQLHIGVSILRLVDAFPAAYPLILFYIANLLKPHRNEYELLCLHLGSGQPS